MLFQNSQPGRVTWSRRYSRVSPVRRPLKKPPPRGKGLAVMSATRCSLLFSRLQRHISSRAACTCAGRSHVSPGVVSGHKKQQAASLTCIRNVSSNNSTPKPPDTSLFVPVSLKTDSALDGSVGAELSQPLDKSE